MHGAVRSTSDSESPIGLPISSVERRAKSSLWSRIRWAYSSRIIFRFRGASSDQTPSSNAVRAAWTASSTSSAPAAATVASTRPSTGLRFSNVSPERASTERLAMIAWPLRLSSAARASQIDGSAVMLMRLPSGERTRPRKLSPRLEILTREGRERRTQHDSEIRDRPERQEGAAGVRAAEGPELDRQTGEPAGLGGDPVERVLVEGLERKRPRRPLGDCLQRVRVERLADLAQQARDQPRPEDHEDRDPVRGRGQEDRPEDAERGDDEDGRRELHAGAQKLVRPPAAGRVRDPRTGGIDGEDVRHTDGGGTQEAADQQRAAPDGASDERLQETALGVSPHDAERQERRQHGPEEERAEHREPEERPTGELALVERETILLGHFLEHVVCAEPVEADVRSGQQDDHVEDATAERLLKAVAGDDRDRPHALSPPTASRYSSSRVVASTRTP